MQSPRDPNQTVAVPAAAAAAAVVLAAAVAIVSTAAGITVTCIPAAIAAVVVAAAAAASVPTAVCAHQCRACGAHPLCVLGPSSHNVEHYHRVLHGADGLCPGCYLWTWVSGCDVEHHHRLLYGAHEVRVQCSLCGRGSRVATLSTSVNPCMVHKKCVSNARCVDMGQGLRG